MRPQGQRGDGVGTALGLQGPGNSGLISLSGLSLLSSLGLSQLWDPQQMRRQSEREGGANNEQPEEGAPGARCLLPAWGSVSLPFWGCLQAVTPGDKESSRRPRPPSAPAVSSLARECASLMDSGVTGPLSAVWAASAPLLAQSHHTCQAGPDWPELLLQRRSNLPTLL